MKRISRSSGFTLLEILLVVAAISILAGIVIVAINPGKQLADTRNAQRKVDTRTIASAISQYRLQNNALPDGIPGGACGTDEGQEICATDAGSCSGLVDLSVLTNDGAFLVSIPIDPSGSITAGSGTGYMVALGSNGRITVCALEAELGATIQVVQ